MDLLTVLAHELGHVIGKGHVDADTHAHDVMAAELETGSQLLSAENRLEASDQWSVISHPSSVIGDQLWTQGVGVRSQGSGVRGLWSPFDGSNDSRSAFHTTRSALEITDALFARLDDRAAAVTDEYELLAETDGSSDEAEGGLDVWGLLF